MAIHGLRTLAAATALLLVARRSPFWRRFWCWLALVAGVKTLLECLTMTAPPASKAERALTFFTLLLFVLGAARWWTRGPREPHPPLTPTAQLALFVSLALWGVFALAPRLVR